MFFGTKLIEYQASFYDLLNLWCFYSINAPHYANHSTIFSYSPPLVSLIIHISHDSSTAVWIASWEKDSISLDSRPQKQHFLLVTPANNYFMAFGYAECFNSFHFINIIDGFLPSLD